MNTMCFCDKENDKRLCYHTYWCKTSTKEGFESVMVATFNSCPKCVQKELQVPCHWIEIGDDY